MSWTAKPLVHFKCLGSALASLQPGSQKGAEDLSPWKKPSWLANSHTSLPEDMKIQGQPELHLGEIPQQGMVRGLISWDILEHCPVTQDSLPLLHSSLFLLFENSGCSMKNTVHPNQCDQKSTRLKIHDVGLQRHLSVCPNIGLNHFCF